MRGAWLLLALLLAGCASPTPPTPHAAGADRGWQAAADDAPRLLSCLAQHRWLAKEGFVATRPTEDAAWPFGVNPALGDLGGGLAVPLQDAIPSGWSALVVTVQLRSGSGSFTLPPSGDGHVHLRDPSVYVRFPAPVDGGFDGMGQTSDAAVDPAKSPALPQTLVFDASYLSTGSGVDLALVSHPHEKTELGMSRVTRIDAFYCDGERIRPEEFLGFDSETQTYRR